MLRAFVRIRIEGADEEVDGDAWVAGFHFGDSGLAGADEVGDFGLGVADAFSALSQRLRTATEAWLRFGGGGLFVCDSSFGVVPS